MLAIEMRKNRRNRFQMHFNTLLFVDFVYFPLYVICRLDNVSDVMDDSVISSMMPAPGRTLDGDELIDDV